MNGDILKCCWKERMVEMPQSHTFYVTLGQKKKQPFLKNPLSLCTALSVMCHEDFCALFMCPEMKNCCLCVLLILAASMCHLRLFFILNLEKGLFSMFYVQGAAERALLLTRIFYWHSSSAHSTNVYLLEVGVLARYHGALVLDGAAGLYWACVPFHRLLLDLDCNQIHEASFSCPR